MDEALRQLLTLGRSHFDKGQYFEAERYLNEVLEHSQAFADVYNMLGVIAHGRGDVAQAQRAFEAALRANPVYTDAALNLAVTYNDQGLYAQARDVYDRALGGMRAGVNQLDPFVQKKISNMYAEIGDAFAAAGRFDLAVDEYRRAVELGPNFADIRLKLAEALRDSGRVEEALSEHERVVANKPGYTAAQLRYGVTLYSAGRRAEAQRVWERVQQDDPTNRLAGTYLAIVQGVELNKSPVGVSREAR